MSEARSAARYPVQNTLLGAPAEGEADDPRAHEVIATYTAHLRSRGAEGRAFDEAVRVYLARHPAVSTEVARHAVATILCHKL